MKDVIFLWIPKNAGTTIYKAMKEINPNMIHISHNEVDKNIKKYNEFRNEGWATFGHVDYEKLVEDGHISKDYWDRAYKFAFVRNPWTRAVSLYRHLQHHDPKNFNGFLKKLLKEDIHPLSLRNVNGNSQANEQIAWLYNKEGKLLVNDVYRFEDLQKEFNYICKEIGVEPIELGWHNKKTDIYYKEYYKDKENIELVRKLFPNDIKMFRYEFNEDELDE